MTMLWCDGFEGQDTSSHYTAGGVHSTVTRFGVGRSFTSSSGAFTTIKTITPSVDVYVGFAYKISVLAASSIIDLLADSGTVPHINVAVNTSGGIDVKRGTTIVASSAAGVLSNDTWAYIEVHGKIADSGGVIEVRVNGNTTPVVTFTGDTKNGGTSGNCDAVRLQVNGSSTTMFDDLYIFDGLGAVNNTFAGDMRVQTVFPSGAGSTTGLNPSTGANWAAVDDAPPSATDYAWSATVGARDTYAMQDLAAGTAAVAGVRACTFWHKSDAGAASMKQALRIGGTVYYNTTVALPTSMGPSSTILQVSPATSAAFTAAEVNALEFGAEVA